MTLPCLILAAGFGTRMGALTADRPKPLIEVAGQCLLDHALDIAQGAGAAPIAANAHYHADQIATHLDGRDVILLHETPDLLDSGGAVKNAMAHLPNGPIATLNADNVWRGANPLRELSGFFDAEKMDALLLLTPRDQAIGREGGGDFRIAPDGHLTLSKLPDSFVYTGAQILNPKGAKDDPRDIFSLRDVWQQAQEKGRLFGLVYSGQWADVGHPAGIEAAEAMVNAHV